MQKMEQTKRKSAKSKKHKSKIKAEKKGEKKGKSKREKKVEKNGLVHLHFFCIYFAFSICFFSLYFAFILLFAWKKAKKMQNKSQKRQIEKAK
jgi:hypothetical protein